MMRDLLLTEKGERISVEEIALFEKTYNLKLPDFYKKFIPYNNGGYPHYTCFENPYEDGFCVNCFYEVTNKEDDIFSDRIISSKFVIDTHQVIEKNIPSNFYPFANTEGNHNICINLNSGEVVIIFLDGTADEPTFVANSFEEFIEALEDIEIYEEE